MYIYSVLVKYRFCGCSTSSPDTDAVGSHSRATLRGHEGQGVGLHFTVYRICSIIFVGWSIGPELESARMIMSHITPGMPRVQDPAKRLSEVIRRINDTRNMSEDNIAGFTPVLDGKMLNIDVTRPFCGYTMIDHVNHRNIVSIKGSCTFLFETKIVHNSTKVFGLFSSEYGGKKFGFRT